MNLFITGLGHIYSPKRQGDVGFDLTVNVRTERQTTLDKIASVFVGEECYIIWPKQMRSIASGVRLAMPRDTWCKIEARSSARDARLLLAGGGVIDNGYRGELFSILYNFGWVPRVLLDGERYTQVVFHSMVVPSAEWVTETTFERLKQTERGTRGFGSTGR